MNETQAITLGSLKPAKPPLKVITQGVLAFLAAVVLITSYRFVGIDPMAFIEKRENAFTYLFGRELTDFDRKDARIQAENLLKIVAMEEAGEELRQRVARSGEAAPLGMTMHRETEALAEEILSKQPEARRAAFVDREYRQILRDKKGGFFPPETSPSALSEYGHGLVETVAMAVWGTLIAVVLAIPAAVLAATNTLALLVQGEGRRHRAFRWGCHFGVRRFLDFCRGFNEFVMALIFVAVIGLGPFAGVLALAVHTFGILGKVVSEAIEAIEPGQMEALVASGAGNMQVISFSVLPQVMPLVVSYSLLRFESNVRSATILGFCGAGGIGFLMFDKINGFEYREVATMMIMIIVSVSLLDYACGKLRSKFI
ncbi:phosphonate ABC transporter, permease protein PhnE [Desulfoluna spongiiphila]|uniref:phosphonate ABC transporter, permease protein PhnE n=1 Tax=Desulfoluna spongiiphila TaxID=419481 RepID=UPI00125C3053|nr:phosphonate ABC transporter, permease protein PhnE [Desulfoluna spongiiphila]VVS91477.1 abc transporter permease phne/ptxc [Desulfoluna spongiiphila]